MRSSGARAQSPANRIAHPTKSLIDRILAHRLPRRMKRREDKSVGARHSFAKEAILAGRFRSLGLIFQVFWDPSRGVPGAQKRTRFFLLSN